MALDVVRRQVVAVQCRVRCSLAGFVYSLVLIGKV